MATEITPSTPVRILSGNRNTVTVAMVGDTKVEHSTVYYSNNRSGRTVRTLLRTEIADKAQAVAAAKALGLIGSELPVGEWNSSTADIYFRGYYSVTPTDGGWHVETHMPNCD